MRTLIRLTLALALAATLVPTGASAQLLPSFGRDRAGTSSFQFLKIPVDARSAAMGQSVASNAAGASALFWNPALAAQSSVLQLDLGHTRYFSDVALDYVAATTRVGRYTFGLSLQSLNSGEMDVTTEFEPFGTGETFRFIDLAAGLTVAQQLTDLFSYGVTGRYVQESVAEVDARTVVFDLGVFYRIGTTGAQMAVAIRNFGIDTSPEGELVRASLGAPGGTVTETEFETLTPPTTFLLGITYTLFRNHPTNRLLLSGQLTNPNDNAENLNVGLEYTWNDLLLLRAGYRLGVEEVNAPSLGVGLQVPGLGPDVRFDYGFSRLERLGAVHRLGAHLSL